MFGISSVILEKRYICEALVNINSAAKLIICADGVRVPLSSSIGTVFVLFIYRRTLPAVRTGVAHTPITYDRKIEPHLFYILKKWFSFVWETCGHFQNLQWMRGTYLLCARPKNGKYLGSTEIVEYENCLCFSAVLSLTT